MTTPAEIQNHKFTVKWKGFEQEEVKHFLYAVSEEFESLIEENHRRSTELAVLRERVKDMEARDKVLKDTLITAQQIKTDINESAVKEAELIIKEAQLKADALHEKAREEVMRIRQQVAEVKRVRDDILAEAEMMVSPLYPFRRGRARGRGRNRQITSFSGRTRTQERGDGAATYPPPDAPTGNRKQEVPLTMAALLLKGLNQVYTARGTAAVVAADDAKIYAQDKAAILVADGLILRVGPEAEVARDLPPGTEICDMGGRVAIPCFVDPHTHLVWGGNRSDEFNQRLHGAAYTEIAARGGGIKATVRHTRAASHEVLRAKGMGTLDQMLLHGVGTVEAKSGYGLDVATEMKQLDVMDALSASHPVAMVQTFLGAHEVPVEYAGRPGAYIDMLNQEMLPEVVTRGTVAYVDIFCEKNVFELEDSRRHLQRALDLGFKLRLHADELHPLGGAGLAAELGALSADHVVYASREHMRAMARAGTMATLLPGTSFFLRSRYADAAAFTEAGCALALSTDYNPGSSHTVSQALMMALACMNLGMTFEQSFVAVTLNAAAAIERADRIGTLEPGKAADIAFLDVPDALHLVYYWGINHVTDVIKDGRFAVRDRQAVYGDAGASA